MGRLVCTRGLRSLGHGLLEAGQVVVGPHPSRGHGARERVVLQVGFPVEVVGVGLVGTDLLVGGLGRHGLASVALQLDAVLHLDGGHDLFVGRAHLLRLLEQRVLE